MNNRGQVLVLFLLILPIMIIGGAVIVDSSYMLYQKNRLDMINDDVLLSFKNSNFIREEDIIKAISKNDERIVNDQISIDKETTIENHMMIDSLFGKVIGLDEYKVTSKKSIDVGELKVLDLDVDKVNRMDNLGNYLLTFNNVTYDNSLVFNNSLLVVNNFKLNPKYEIELSFIYNTGDCTLINFNNLNVTIKENKLYFNNIYISDLVDNTKYLLRIDNSSLTFNNKTININSQINNLSKQLIIGQNFIGKINYLKIYMIRK